MNRYAGLTAVAAALALAGAAEGAHVVQLDPEGLVRVPYRMESSNQAGWWKPLAVDRGVVYLAFNGHLDGGRHTVRVARYSSGRWWQACLQRDHRCVRYRDDVGHCQPTIAVDGDRKVHVFASMHHNRWRYFRSERPGSVRTMRFRGSELGRRPGRFTYPIAATAPNGDVWLIVRQTGVSPPRGRLYRWSVADHDWYSLGSFAYADGHGVYPDDLVVGPDGRVHLLFSWSGGHASALKHAGSYLVYDPATGVYANAAGDPVTVPVTPESPVVFQPFEPGEDWTHVMDGFGQRGAKLTLDPAGRPVVAYRYQAPADAGRAPLGEDAKVRTATWNGAAWELAVVYEGQTSAALGITHHDEPIVYTAEPGTPSGTIAVVQTGTTDYVYRASPADEALFVGRVRAPTWSGRRG